MMKRHASVSAETASKLREIIAVFKHDANKLNMHGWGYKYDKRKTKAVQDAGTQTSSCGTVGCIAGWACFLNLKPKELKENLRVNSVYDGPVRALEFRENDIIQVANSLLGLPSDLGRRVNLHPLFFVAAWPQEFMTAYTNADVGDTKTRARITIKRINHYIATGE